MDYRSQEIKAGIMIVASFLLFLIFLVAISGLDFLQSKKEYIARFHYTSGLEVGSIVRFGGMEVGTIKAMRIFEEDDSKIEFIVEVDESIPVKTNSEAIVTSIGIMGEYHINISTGHPDSALLPPGSILKSKDVPSITQLMEPIGQIADQVNTTLVDLQEFLGSENQQQFQSILANLNTMLEANQESVALMVENLNQAIESMNRMGGKVDQLLAANEASISGSVKNLEATLEQTKVLLKTIDKIMLDLDRMVLTKSDNFNQIMDNLSQTSNHLEEFSRSIKERPWQLIRKSAPKERKID
ncbi:MCE family protein [candidate division KSB1 bacterium]|nr:MCE family protein [candidate division KSB1 bacterium]